MKFCKWAVTVRVLLLNTTLTEAMCRSEGLAAVCGLGIETVCAEAAVGTVMRAPARAATVAKERSVLGRMRMPFDGRGTIRALRSR